MSQKTTGNKGMDKRQHHATIMGFPKNVAPTLVSNIESKVPNIKMLPAPDNAELDLCMPPFIEAIKFRERFLHWLTWEWIDASWKQRYKQVQAHKISKQR